MVDVSVSEIAESPAEKRIGTEILDGAVHELNSYLVVVYLEKPQNHIAEEIDKIPEEHEKQNYSDGDYD